MDFGQIFENALRSVLWFVARFSLMVIDFAYDTLLEIYRIDLTDFPFIWDWFRGISILLFIFILIRLVFMYFRTFYDDEAIERLDGIGILRRLFSISVIMVMLPVMLPGLSNISSSLVEKLPEIVGVGENRPSTILIQAGMADFNDLNQDISIGNETGLIERVNMDSVNEKNDQGEYVYFEKTENIALVLILSVVCCYCYVFVCIQIAQRILGILLKILLAPYSLSGLVDAKDHSTGTWMRMIASDFLVNFFQMTMILLSMVTSLAVPLTGLAKGLFFIGTIFGIMHSPTGISQLLGADVGASEAFGQLQTGLTLGRAIHTGGHVLSSTAATASAAGVYGVGRMVGGRTLNPSKVMDRMVESDPGGYGNGGSGIGGISGYSGMIQENRNTYGSDTVYDQDQLMNQRQTDSQTSVAEMREAGGSEKPVGYVNHRGTVSYTDGHLVNQESFLARHGRNSTVGRMGSRLAGQMYRRAAEKLYVPKDARMNTARDRRFVAMMTSMQKNRMYEMNNSRRKTDAVQLSEKLQTGKTDC